LGVPVGKPERLARLLRACVYHPARTGLVWIGIVAIFLTGVLRLDIETSTDSVLSRDHSDWQFYRQYVDQFGGDEVLVVALSAEKPFAPAVLDRVAGLTAAMERVPGVRRVDSVATVPVIRLDADGALVLSPLFEDLPSASMDSREARVELLRDRIAPRLLVSEDGRVFAVTARMEDVRADYDANVVDEALDATSGREAWLSGGPLVRIATNRTIRSDLLTFIPATGLLIVLIQLIIFRTLWAAWVPLAIGGVAAFSALGAMGALGISLTVSTVVLPSLLVALACAYSMHLIAAAIRTGTDPESLARGIQPLVRPIALSGLTTTLAFLAMSFVRIDVVRDVGGFGALGSLVVVVASLTLGPALLVRRKVAPHSASLTSWVEDRLAPRLARFVATYRWGLVGCWGLATLALSAGIYRLEVETDPVLWFPKGSEVREDYERIRDALAGISPMSVVISSTSDRLVTDPEAIYAIDGLERYLESLPRVGRALSVADPLRQVHGVLRGDPTQPIPDSRDLIEQYLLLLESVDQMQDFITDDRTEASVLIRADNNGSRDLLEIAHLAEAWWGDHGAAGFTAKTTGIMHEYARSEEEIASGQIRGLAFAAITISLLLFLSLRSARLAGTALIPNLVPLFFLFGFMGLRGLPLDISSVMLGSLALGIGVDDTVHLVSAYHERRLHGDSSDAAVRGALCASLPAVSYSTLAIASGFGVLGLSGFVITRNFGDLTGSIMICCYLADVTLLPALLGGFPGQTGRPGPAESVREPVDP
jgi:predicted RND superfamily exporter protein